MFQGSQSAWGSRITQTDQQGRKPWSGLWTPRIEDAVARCIFPEVVLCEHCVNGWARSTETTSTLRQHFVCDDLQSRKKHAGQNFPSNTKQRNSSIYVTAVSTFVLVQSHNVGVLEVLRKSKNPARNAHFTLSSLNTLALASRSCINLDLNDWMNLLTLLL